MFFQFLDILTFQEHLEELRVDLRKIILSNMISYESHRLLRQVPGNRQTESRIRRHGHE